VADDTPATNTPLDDPGPLGDDAVPPDDGQGTGEDESEEDVSAHSPVEGPATIEVAVFATPDLLDPNYSDLLTEDVDLRDHAAAHLRTALNDLSHYADRLVSVDVRVADATVDTSGTDSIHDEFRAFEAWLDSHPDERATDANLLLSHENGGGLGYAPRCQLDDTCVGELDADVAIAQSVEWFYAPYLDFSSFDEYDVDTTIRQRIEGTRVDTDGDGWFEDYNGDGEVTFVDVVDLLNTIDDANPPLSNYDGKDGVDFLDVVTLLYELDEGGFAVPEALSYNGYAFAGHVCVHEVGHNLGFQHDMGTAYVEEVGGGTDRIRISPMLSTYYLVDRGPSPGDENRVGDTIPAREGRDLAFTYRYGSPVRNNVGEWVYDEQT
jgi:hypothetical protein